MAPGWKPGEARSPCRFESCPFRCSTRACSWESSQAPTLTQRVRLLPLLLTVSVAEQPRHRPAASDRRVRLPPDTLTPCEEAGVHRPGCLPGIDGFDSRTGRFFGPWTERRGDRLIRGQRQVRLLPARLGNGLERLQRGLMSLPRRVRLPLPRLVLQSYPRGPAATAPLLQRGNHRRFESCRGYCGVDWSQAPARSHKPSPRRFKSGPRN